MKYILTGFILGLCLLPPPTHAQSYVSAFSSGGGFSGLNFNRGASRPSIPTHGSISRPHRAAAEERHERAIAENERLRNLPPPCGNTWRDYTRRECPQTVRHLD